MKLVAPVVVALALLTSCAGSGHGGSTSATTVPVQRTQTFVALGSDVTVGDGLRDPFQTDWPRVVWREAFPRATVFVNTALRGATAGAALNNQVPLAVQLQPASVAVWLGMVEAANGTPVKRFAANLSAVVQQLASTGAQVFVADLPVFGSVPNAAYNAAIARVVANAGATLVPLHSVSVPTVRGAKLFLPNEEGHRAVAKAFETAMRSAANA